MASVRSTYARSAFRHMDSALEAASADDLIALMKRIATLVGNKPGAPDMSTVQTDLTSASACVID